MFLLLLTLFVVPNMSNKFWLIIAEFPPHYKRDEEWSSVYSQKMGQCSFSSKMGEVGKMMEEGFLL